MASMPTLNTTDKAVFHLTISFMLVQVTIYRRLRIGKPKLTIYRKLYEYTDQGCRAANRLGVKVLRYFDTLVLEYRFCSARRYSVLVLLKSTCTRACAQVLLKMKVLLTSTLPVLVILD